MPPRDNGLLCKNWTFTGSVPHGGGETGLFTLSGYSLSQKKVAAFLGESTKNLFQLCFGQTK